MRFESSAKTVLVPTKIVNGNFYYLQGGELPKFRDGTIIDLIVPKDAIEDKTFLNKLESNDTAELLPKGLTVYASVSSSGIPQDLRDAACSMSFLLKGRIDTLVASLVPNTLFVEIMLEGPLSLQLRGTKHGRLKLVKCWIPSLNKEARSLNHAYFLISDKFEPQRYSHVGNVFQQIWYINSDKQFFPLEKLRTDVEERYEATLH